MKSDDIKRSVKSARNERGEGDAPNIGRVARMPGTGLPKGVRRKRRRSEGGRDNRVREGRRRIVLTWSLLLSGVAVVILGGAIWLWIRPNMQQRENLSDQPALVAEVSQFLAPKFPSPSEADALALVRQALVLRDPEKAADCFRPCDSSPERMVEFIKSLGSVDGPVSRTDWLGSMDANGLSIDGVLVGFKGADKPRNRVALLTPDEQGRWKIDFDAFARMVSPSWREFLEKRADVAQVRVYAALDSYYNGVFIDETRWICYGIASPDTEDILLAYCRIGSPQAAAMNWIFKKDSRLNRATLEIRRVEGAEPRQFELSRVLAEDWVMGPVPFEDRFK